MTFEIIDITVVESTNQAQLQATTNQTNEFQITNLIVDDSVNQIYLGNIDTISSGFQIYDLEVEEAVQYYYTQTNIFPPVTDILTSTEDGPFSDSPYLFLTSDYGTYINPIDYANNPSAYPQVFVLPENCTINSLSFINNNGPLNPSGVLCNVVNFNFAFTTVNLLFQGSEPGSSPDISFFNVERTPDVIPIITDNIYFIFSPNSSLGSLTPPAQIKMNIEYTV